MDKFNIKYFLAANSCEGFISCFAESYSANDNWRVYIIKGGPGTGKSSFMRYLASVAEERKAEYELCFCSSDPNSLDAVIFPEKKAIVLDGTAPHTLDPVYPGVCEKILNFGEFWQEEQLVKNRKKIIELTDKNKKTHNTAARYLSAAGELFEDNLRLAKSVTDIAKVEKFGNKLCKNYIPKKDEKQGKEQIRFLCGTTPAGVVSFAKSAVAQIKNVVVIEDKFGAVSNEIMETVRKKALLGGHNIITVKNCFLPFKLIDNIIIPELSLAVVREWDYQHFDMDVRRIHARRFMSNEQLKLYRERINFNKKTIKELLSGAVATLRQAKAIHDELEECYVSAMDFDRLTGFAKEFSKKLFY